MRQKSASALEFGQGKGANSAKLSEEEAWAMPLDQIQEAVNEVTGLAARAKHRPPAGVGLQTGFVGTTGKALETVYCEKGEHVVENAVSRYGVCRLRLTRLGAPVGAQLYFDQVAARVGVSGVEGWTWVNHNSGQEMHVLLLIWIQE